jgi:DNA-binding response OmpR family regulator
MADAHKSTHIYLAIKSARDRSNFADVLVLDGFNASMFPTAGGLWDTFRLRPVRFVISERRFPEGLDGLVLAENIRQKFLLPYCYIVMLSDMNSLAEIREGLGAGVDDYLSKPITPLQIRTRIQVGLRWLAYIDSLQASAATGNQPAN